MWVLRQPGCQTGIAVSVELPAQEEVEAEEHRFGKSLFAHIMAKAAVGGHQMLWLLS